MNILWQLCTVYSVLYFVCIVNQFRNRLLWPWPLERSLLFWELLRLSTKKSISNELRWEVQGWVNIPWSLVYPCYVMLSMYKANKSVVVVVAGLNFVYKSYSHSHGNWATLFWHLLKIKDVQFHVHKMCFDHVQSNFKGRKLYHCISLPGKSAKELRVLLEVIYPLFQRKILLFPVDPVDHHV